MHAMADWLAARGVDLVVCAGYMHLLDHRASSTASPIALVDVHPAPLPAFPGHASRSRIALAAGATETGATVHYVDEGVDTGPGDRGRSQCRSAPTTPSSR